MEEEITRGKEPNAISNRAPEMPNRNPQRVGERKMFSSKLPQSFWQRKRISQRKI
jgi:hypothetical protein